MYFINTITYYVKRIQPFFITFLLIQIILRVALLIREFDNIDVSVVTVGVAFAAGLLFDLSAAVYYLTPFLFYMLILPSSFHLKKMDRLITKAGYYIYTYLVLFGLVSEWFFWDEFGSRFNFIAVDYLVYTREVIGNIYESYPLIFLLAGIGFVAGLFYMFTKRFLLPEQAPVFFQKSSFGVRLQTVLVMLIIIPVIFFGVDISYAAVSNNRYVNEIAKDGIYSLFSAFIHNELDYQTFYKTDSMADITKRLQGKLNAKNSIFANKDTIRRYVNSGKPEKKHNIIIVTMESMGSRFMGRFGNKANLTPNLDRLSKESLFFSKIYSTGSRTVRGLEAITLSIPPSPGRSIIKRTDNENLFSLGFIFQDHGYDTKFLYGGYGYFDNMNYFFANNGFNIVDRTNFSDDEVTFSNIWGVSDENLYDKVLQQADNSYKDDKPFMYMVMTTSNHRPYTYPEGKIDIPSHSGRKGGVKYADFALGEFIEDAKKHSWFKDTIFVIVADHSTGWSKQELDISKYHIPLMFYAPEIFKPRDVKKLASQIDLAPTLLGVLDFSYESRFYGNDILSSQIKRAFIGNYQMLGYLTDDQLTILKPVKESITYRINENENENESAFDSDLPDAISYYQHASNWKDHKRIDNSISKTDTTLANK